MAKGRKKISDESKRLRGTDQPCRMDGAVVPVNPVAALPKAKGLKGCPCWGGLDLSNVSDITAFVLIFHEEDKFQLLPFFWIPEEKMLEEQVERITGKRMYSEYDSFRRGYLRWKNEKRSPK